MRSSQSAHAVRIPSIGRHSATVCLQPWQIGLNVLPYQYLLMLHRVLHNARPHLSTASFSRRLVPVRFQMDTSRPVERTIRAKLTQALDPKHLEVQNESHMHAVPAGSESHFRVLVVSSHFEGLSPLQRHRLVNEALREELSGSVHALAIQTKTPEQWEENPTLAKSPPCLGGSKHDSTMGEKLKAAQD